MGKNFDVSGARDHRLVAVDEIISLFQFPALHKLLKANQTVAVASHLHPLWFKILGPTLPIRSFQTDRGRRETSRLPASQRSTVLGRGSPKFLRALPGQLRRAAMHPRAQPRAKPRPCPQLQPEIRQNHDFEKEGLDAHTPSSEVPLKVFEPSLLFSFAKNEMLR